ARARFVGRPGPAPPRRADEPPGRRQPRVARAGAAVARRRNRPRRTRPLVPRGGHDLRARARGRALDLLPRALARVASREGGAGEKHVLSNVSFAIERGEHVALVGPNGSGKTTLLEELLRRPLGYGVVPAYFSQQELELDERGSVLDCAMSMTGLKRPQAQALLGRFLFSGWEAHEKPVVALSGGERRRLALAAVVASGANFLVLDEPPNHLDLDGREALEAALEA